MRQIQENFTRKWKTAALQPGKGIQWGHNSLWKAARTHGAANSVGLTSCLSSHLHNTPLWPVQWRISRHGPNETRPSKCGLTRFPTCSNTRISLIPSAFSFPSSYPLCLATSFLSTDQRNTKDWYKTSALPSHRPWNTVRPTPRVRWERRQSDKFITEACFPSHHAHYPALWHTAGVTIWPPRHGAVILTLGNRVMSSRPLWTA